MDPIARINKALRGNVPLTAVAKELVRKIGVRSHHGRERREMDVINAAPARLTSEFSPFSSDKLRDHFLERMSPLLWATDVAETQRREFQTETADLMAAANTIVDENTWEVGGFGKIKFDRPNYWRCDPLSGVDWGLDYHADIPIYTPGGPDIRVLWELNRFIHVLALARAFEITKEEKYAETFFRHLEEWTAQNPYARGANWRSPMDVIMRAVNVVAAFELVKAAECCTPARIALILKITDTHCRFMVDNNEFSHIATGNHYITNVAGLFFVATLLPELEHAAKWRDWGLSELLRECKKQVLPDGVDWESSTGYHKFVTEILLTCLLVAERNGIDIAEEHKTRCRKMLEYLRAVIRPDGGMPLIGDCDGSQFLPIVRRDADDAKYLLDMAAVACGEAEFKIGDECSPEVLWLFGSGGVERYSQMQVSQVSSAQFPNAGTYILRHEDLYVMLNANDVGLNGRGSHSHNDALSIEISALGHAWIVDPGSYVYNLDREARHRFRSTASHSTLMVDGREQNKIEVDQPFVSSNDARPKPCRWAADDDLVSAEHYGNSPIVHRRTVSLDRVNRVFTIHDELSAKPKGDVFVYFHFAPHLYPVRKNGISVVEDAEFNRLAIVPDLNAKSALIPSQFSRHYGHKQPSPIVRWKLSGDLLGTSSTFHLVPITPTEDLEARLASLHHLLHNKA